MTTFLLVSRLFLPGRSRANPFRPSPAPSRRWRPKPAKAAEDEWRSAPLARWEEARRRRGSLVMAVWLWLVIGLFVVAVLGGIYGWMEIRHERELRGLGRRIRKVETQLRQTEIRLHLAHQENQKLQSELACQQAALAMMGGSMAKSQGLKVARSP